MNFAQRWIAFRTLLIKEIRRILRIWPQTLLPPVITMSLYFVIFGKMIGSRVGEMGGVPYMQFIVPGLIMMAIITNSYSNVVSSFFSAKFHSSIEELLVSPISKHAILTGYISGGIFRDAYNVYGGIDKVIPVDVYVPGCAARPEAIIDGVVQALAILDERAKERKRQRKMVAV